MNMMMSIIVNMAHDINWDVCLECRASMMVWDRDGDIVCSNCGLVKQEKYVIDDIYTEQVFPINEDEYKKSTLLNTYWSDLENTSLRDMCLLLYNKLTCCSNEDTESAVDTEKNRISMAISAYYAARCLKLSYTCEYLCSLFQTCPKKFWKARNKALEAWRDLNCYSDIICTSENDNGLRKMIYELDDEIVGNKWNVYNIATQIFEQIKDHIYGCKLSKLNACIIYIACKVQRICKADCCLKYICRLYKISPTTVLKHEKHIQNVLEICA